MEIVGVFLDPSFATTVPVGHELTRVGVEVAVRVAHQPQVWRLADEHAVFQHLDRPRENETVGEDGSLVHHAVMVRVFEHHDPANRIEVRLRRGQRLDESGHLDHPDAALRIPVDHDRVLDQGFTGDEFETVARRQRERLKCLSWREGRRLWPHLLHRWGPCASG